MKVLYVFNDSSEFAAKFYVNEFHELQKLGWQIDLACNYDKNVPFLTHVYPMKWNRNPFRLSTFSGIRAIRKLIQKNSYDVIYCSSPIGGLIGRLAAKQIRSYHPGVIYFCHGFHFYKGCNPIRWLVFYPVEKWLSHYTDVLATINREDYLIAKSRMYQKQLFLSHGIGADFEKYVSTNLSSIEKNDLKNSLGVSQFFPILFYAAEISKLKNQQFLLKVLLILQKAGFCPALLLAGRDRTKGRFLKKIRRIGLEKNVKLLGFRDDCPALLQISDFCTPSSTREGLGLNLVEAMCCGIPVVATDNRGHREVIRTGENGYLVSTKKPQEMAEKIVFCIKNENYTKRIVAEARKDCEQYSFSEVFPGIMNIYQAAFSFKR
jgi:glycosyltransferase EpsD